MASFVFPKLDLPKPQRSNRDLSHTRVGSFAIGTLNPVLCMDVLPGDNITVKLSALIESFPMLAPAMSGYKVSFDAYFCPWSNYYGWMSNDTRLSTEQIIKRKRHHFNIGYSVGMTGSVAVDALKRYSVPAGSLLNRLGVPADFFGQVLVSGDNTAQQIDPLAIPAEGVLAYYDILRHYYVNNQEDSVPIGAFRSTSRDGFELTSLSALDDAFRSLRNRVDGGMLNDTLFGTLVYDPGTEIQGYRAFKGLALRSYRMDLLRGVLSTADSNYKAYVDTTGGQVSYDTILETGKLFDLIQRIDVTGGRFSDWMWTRWHVKPYNDIHRPVYLGSITQTFGNVDVLSASAGTQYGEDGEVISSSGAGQQTGFAVGRVDREKSAFNVRSSQYGTLMVIMSMVPLVRYSQGFNLNLLKTTFADIYDPAFAQIGYQDVSRYELSATPTLTGYVADTGMAMFHENSRKSDLVARRIAWSEYMGAVDIADGQFAQGQSLDYWAFNRVYTRDNDGVTMDPNDPNYTFLKPMGDFDMTSYVYPYDWNSLFVDTAPDAENFRYRVSFDIRAKRPIGNRVLPHS